MRFLIWLFLLATNAHASVLPECPTNSHAKAHIAETAFYEWRLIEEVLLREQARLSLLMSEGFSYERAEAKTRVNLFEKIAKAKKQTALDEIETIPKTDSIWLSEIRDQLLNFTKGKNRAQHGQICGHETQAFLDRFHSDPKPVAIRWESLRIALGAKAVNRFLLRHLGYQKLLVAEPASEQLQKIVHLTEATAAVKISGALIYRSSEFSDIRAKAEELNTFILKNASREAPVVLVTEGSSSSIVSALLDRYPTFRTEGSISAWIIVNGSIAGDLEQRPNPIIRRALASTSPGSRAEHQIIFDRQKRRTEIPLGIGQGFPIVSIVEEGRIESDDFDLSLSSPAGSLNYLLPAKTLNVQTIQSLIQALKSPR